LCLPPGPHIPLILQAAIEAGVHAIVEKPWLCSRDETEQLVMLACAKRLRTGIHYEYCLIDEVENWRRRFGGGVGFHYGGRFGLSRPDHLGLSAIDNLGSHLMAVRDYAVPNAEISEICCGYELPDERCVWLENNGQRIASIDFLGNEQPIIQRFIAKFEAGIEGGEFPWDLSFGLRVAQDITALAERLKHDTMTSKGR
jgi:hypothetical protein